MPPCVDCGTPINPNLTRVQTEGGILQGIGMALYREHHLRRQGLADGEFLHAVQDPRPVLDIGRHPGGV